MSENRVIPTGGILFTSDWHCGLISNGVHRNDEIKSVLDEITDKAAELNPSAIVIVGDLTEQFRYPGLGTASLVGETLVNMRRRMPNTKIIVIKGNHDWDGVNLFGLNPDTNIRILDRPGVIEVKPDEYVICVPYLKKHEMDGMTYDEIIQKLKAEYVPDNAICTAAVHAALEGTVPMIREECVTPDVLKCGIDNIMLGHIHQHKRITDNIYYTGSIIRNTFGEEVERSGLWYISGQEVFDILLENSRNLVNIEIASPEEAVEGALESEICRVLENDPSALIKVKVPGGMANALQIEDIIRRAEQSGTDGEQATAKDKKNKKVIAIDLSLKNVKEEADHAIQEADIQAGAIADRISVRALWSRYCMEKGAANMSDEERAVITACGDAFLSGSTAGDIWEALKDGKLTSLAKDIPAQTADSIQEPVAAEYTEPPSDDDIILFDADMSDIDLDINF